MIITLSGSITRAMTAMRRIERALVLAGHTVYVPCPPLPDEPPLTPQQLHNLTVGHHRAIRGSDLVIAVVPDRAVGDSTRSETQYAEQHGVRVIWVWDAGAFLIDITAGRLDSAEVPA